MKSSVDWEYDGRGGLQFCNREGGCIAKVGGACGEDRTVLSGTTEMYKELCGSTAAPANHMRALP
jgi:hypothetical protein